MHVSAERVGSLRRVGGPAVELMLASPATGPVEKVWFAQDGRLFALDSGTLSRLGFEHEEQVIRSWNAPL